MKKSLVILASALVLMVSSCQKDEDEPAGVEVNVQNLSGSYQLSKIGVKVDNSGEEDVTRFLVDSCELDDVFSFQPDLTYSYVDAGTTCDTIANTINGVWSLRDNATMIISDSTYGIRRFDGTNLELNDTDVVNNVTAVYTLYYRKQ